MTLQQLKYAIEIANCGSFNEAAKRLFISQPSLSKAIKELEVELGIGIFERTNRGISISIDGAEFLGYARQIIEQTEVLENRYHGERFKALHFSLSTQHYAFVVDAFIKLMKSNDNSKYEFTLKETKTYEIIEDVKTLKSDIGILYTNDLNSKVMNKLFSDSNIKFTPLFNVTPHVFVGKNHPLLNKKVVTMEDLTSFPFIVFDQGEKNSLNFSEEILNFSNTNKSIVVNDRATLSNLLTGSDGYTVGTGVLVPAFNGDEIQSIPIESDQIVTIGWICHKNIKLSKIASKYIEILNYDIATKYLEFNYCLL
ncbi:LysR family transcriptional regulator [Clostridium kluyveri]|uniref:LysR family transcriptional regulator n=1 Tax=Clostridium kluyveri TaxID=1534 RepID=A0A1L5F8M3_CLOKL|nr:LysR family transcriptional regulator [Clostridium kluyveri]APM39364.1 LysR family transcriptional regulator [Clostridium kluyveri]UZQ52747.1 LysR family transcriptional regulator [Clostridium kluyveri]